MKRQPKHLDGPPGNVDGGSTYRLNVPANPPVKLYWSATVYDRATHALIRDMKWPSRSSNGKVPQREMLTLELASSRRRLPQGDDSTIMKF
jgi:hypothetical protein